MRDVQAERRLAGGGRGGGEEGVGRMGEDGGRRCLLPRAQRSVGRPGRQGQAETVLSGSWSYEFGRRRLAAPPDGSGVTPLRPSPGRPCRAPRGRRSRTTASRCRRRARAPSSPRARVDRVEPIGRAAALEPQVVRVLGVAVVELDADRAGEQRRARGDERPVLGVGVARDDLEEARVVRRRRREAAGAAGRGVPGPGVVPPGAGRVAAACRRCPAAPRACVQLAGRPRRSARDLALARRALRARLGAPPPPARRREPRRAAPARGRGRRRGSLAP